jgi:hypothetical protein
MDARRCAGSAVYVHGFRDATAGAYNVTLDGATRVFDGAAPWKELALLFYATGLDPQAEHSLEIVNAGDGILAVGGLNVLSVIGGKSSVRPLSLCAHSPIHY